MIAGLDFLRAFAALGGPGIVDAVGFHPYSFPFPPAYPASWNVWAQMSSNPASFESILRSSGYPGKKIWITEYGAPTNGPGIAATSDDYRIGGHPDHADEALQAVMATQSVQLARSSPVIGAFFWYSYRDLGTDASDRENFFGLRHVDGTPKPAYAALQQAIAVPPAG